MAVYGLPPDVKVVRLQLKGNATIPTWQLDEDLCTQAATIRKTGSVQKTFHSLYVETWKDGGKPYQTPRIIAYNTVDVPLGPGHTFEVLLQGYGGVSNCSLEFHASIAGWWR